MHTTIQFIAFQILFTLLFGCSSGPVKTRASEKDPADFSNTPHRSSSDEAVREAQDSSSPDAKAFASIDALYRQKSFQETIQKAAAFTKAYPESRYLDHVYNLKGLAHISLKQFQYAEQMFKKCSEIADDDYLKSMSLYNLAYVYFELGNMKEAWDALDQVKQNTLDKSDRVKFFVLRAKTMRMKQDYTESANEILKALENLPEPRSRTSAEPMLNFLDEVIDPIKNIPSLEKLLSDHEDSIAADRILNKLGTYYLSVGEKDRSRSYFEKIISNYPESRFYSSAKDAVQKTNFQGAVDPKRIGVVLTLSGKFGKFGYKALQGIELALKIFNPKNELSPVTIVVMDDQGTPEKALQSMDELYYKHHVMGIIGPLVSKLAEPMSKKAQELGIPLITLSQKEATGEYTFNAALTPAMQVRELVEYAVNKAKVKNFAVLSPSGKFGTEYVKAFWDEVDRLGGSIRGFETYPDDETDFRVYIDKLVGLSQTEARAREVEELKLLKAATPVKTRSKKFDRMFDLKPIVDFEAVFIPDEPKTLGQILPTFAYLDVEKVLFIGINTWNNPELITRAGQFAEGAVFVDGFFSGSQSEAAKKFSQEYTLTFNQEPSLVEALAFDAAQIYSNLLKAGDVTSRGDLKDRIHNLKNFPGVSGKISYLDGKLTRDLSLLTVKNGKIEAIAF